MKRVLVTGATGYLGSHLIPKLQEKDIDCCISNSEYGNLLSYNNLYQYNHLKFDYIFHLATWAWAGDFCLHHQAEQYFINEEMNINIIKYWSTNQRQAKFIGIGTSCAFDPQLEMIEENYLKGEPYYDLFSYAMTKRMMLVGLIACAKQHGMKYTYLIPSTIYGPHFSELDNHFIYDLIRKIKKAKALNEPAALWGNGYQSRDVIYIDDLVNSIILSMDEDYNNEIFNISSGISYTIRGYAMRICKLLDIDFDKYVTFDETAYSGVQNKMLDIRKATDWELLSNLTPLDIGLKKLING